MNKIQQVLKESEERIDKEGTLRIVIYAGTKTQVANNDIKNLIKQSHQDILKAVLEEIEKQLDSPPPYSSDITNPAKHIHQNEGYIKGIESVKSLLENNIE